MNKLILISLLLIILGFSGCSSTIKQVQIDNFSELFINDTNSSLNYTYSSSKIQNLTNITGYTGNVTIVSSVTPLLFVTFQYQNGILKAVS